MALSDAISKVKSAYKAGSQQVDSMGPELKARAEMNQLGRKALSGDPKPAAQPAKPVETSPKDKINPDAKYGDRGTEKRIDTGSMTKPLGSFKKGGKVPKTGVYKLHEGEQVIPKSKSQSALAGDGKPKKKGSGRVPQKMTIRKMDDNSFHITHDHQSPNKTEMPTSPASEEFTVQNPKQLTRHVRNTFSSPADADGEQ